MTRGNFDLHFTPVEEMDRMAPYHFAVEVEDWDGFLAHLDKLGIRHTRVITRPENNSQFCYIHDPDHTMIELVFHERRPYPPVPKKETGRTAVSRPVAWPRRAPSQPRRRAPSWPRPRDGSAAWPSLFPATRRSTTRCTGRVPPCCSCTGRAGTTPRGGSRSPRCLRSYTVITVDLRGLRELPLGVGPRRAELPRRHHRGARRGRRPTAARPRAVLVGQSIGAAAALRAALDRPDRASGVILGALARRAAGRGAHRAGEGRPGASPSSFRCSTGC